jgi:signal transduction histidine kinase
MPLVDPHYREANRARSPFLLWSLFYLLVCALFVAALCSAAYPTWRIAITGALLAGVGAMRVYFGMLLVPDVGPPKAHACSKPGFLPWAMSLLALLAVAAITGGLRSPFLVGAMGPFSGFLITYGWSRESKAALVLVIGGALAMAALPARWIGEPVAAPAYSVLAAMTLMAAVTVHTVHFVILSRALSASHYEVDRAREEMAEQALARARELEQLSAQLSHELKNPLGAIKTLVQLAGRDAGTEKTRERLRVAESEIERMNGILKEYLSFSRPLDRVRRKPVDLASLADEVLQLLGPQASGAGVALSRRGAARVEADARRIKEALFNLVANSLEATPRGGGVEIEIAARGRAVYLAVRDSGRGMPPQVLERLGTPFFTTREEGTGLGVAMARAAFVQHGGTLEYASQEGGGTVATAVLPLRMA